MYAGGDLLTLVSVSILSILIGVSILSILARLSILSILADVSILSMLSGYSEYTEEGQVQENYKCPEDCGKIFKAPQSLREHVRFKHQESPEKGEPRAQARKVPIVEEDFATAELVRGKHMDIEEAASYGACDKPALK